MEEWKRNSALLRLHQSYLRPLLLYMGKYLASASADATIRLWDIRNEIQKQPLRKWTIISNNRPLNFAQAANQNAIIMLIHHTSLKFFFFWVNNVKTINTNNITHWNAKDFQKELWVVFSISVCFPPKRAYDQTVRLLAQNANFNLNRAFPLFLSVPPQERKQIQYKVYGFTDSHFSKISQIINP